MGYKVFKGSKSMVKAIHNSKEELKEELSEKEGYKKENLKVEEKENFIIVKKVK